MLNILRVLLMIVPLALPAAVLLNQPVVVSDGRASTTSGPSTGFMTWERFSLTDSASITRISFIGAFIDTVTTANNPVAPSGVNWNFQLAGDNAGNPGTVTGSQSLAFASVSQTFLGSASLVGQPVQVYSFVADLPAPLFVSGGQTTWLTVFSSAATTVPSFAWFSGSGGDGVSKQVNLGTNGITTHADRALILEDTTVPEPGTLALAGAGIALAMAMRRRAGYMK